MSQLPLFGAPFASWVVRSATERCRIESLPNVIGWDSSEVGPAEAVSGVKVGNRPLWALATPVPATETATTTAAARTGSATRVHFRMLTFLPFHDRGTDSTAAV